LFYTDDDVDRKFIALPAFEKKFQIAGDCSPGFFRRFTPSKPGTRPLYCKLWFCPFCHTQRIGKFFKALLPNIRLASAFRPRWLYVGQRHQELGIPRTQQAYDLFPAKLAAMHEKLAKACRQVPGGALYSMLIPTKKGVRLTTRVLFLLDAPDSLLVPRGVMRVPPLPTGYPYGAYGHYYQTAGALPGEDDSQEPIYLHTETELAKALARFFTYPFQWLNGPPPMMRGLIQLRKRKRLRTFATYGALYSPE
jgi:hypothetical protein